MRTIPPPLVSLNSSSESQQPVDYSSASRSKEQQQQQQKAGQTSTAAPSNLMDDISTLRNRLEHLDSGDSPMNQTNRSNNHRRTSEGGRREPPQSSAMGNNDGGEPALVTQLRAQLKSMEAQKAEMELTLMNQMSNLAYENQTTIDGLHARLAKSEQLVETLQQESAISTNGAAPEDRLRLSLQEERTMRKALEEERNAQAKQLKDLQEKRDSAEQEVSTLQEGLDKMQQHMNILHSANVDLTAQVKHLQQSNAAKNAEHQAQMSEITKSYQQRYQQLEEQLSAPEMADKAGVANLHRKIAELENENDEFSREVVELSEKLSTEQSMNNDLEAALEEQTNNSAKLWESLEESRQRCTALENELTAQAEKHSENNDSIDEGTNLALQKENEMLANQIVAIHEQCVSEQEKCAKLKSSLESERNTNSKLRLSLRQHQQRYEELNRNLRRNQSGAEMVNGATAALEKEKKALEEQLAKEKFRVSELEALLTQRQSTIDDQLQNTAGRRQSDVAALENAQLELQSVMNSYQSDVAQLERKLKLMESQLGERNRQNQRLEVEINEERRIRKSLTSQLEKLKITSRSGSSNKEERDTASSGSRDAEIQRLQKENSKLSDELKQHASLSGRVDPAEVEFLRKQNRLLGERADCLHGEQMKEMENLRDKNMQLTAELNELRSAADRNGHQRSGSNGSLLYKDQKLELEQLKQQNADLKEELTALKQQLSSSGRSEFPPSPRQKTLQPPSPRRAFNVRSKSPAPHGSSALTAAGMQTPPMSPPPSTRRIRPGSPMNPVQGIVESFEQRISRTNSSNSLAAMSEAAKKGTTEGQDTASVNDSQGSTQAHKITVSELESVRGELQEEKTYTKALSEKYTRELDLVESLRQKLTVLEQSESKRGQLEKSLQDREEEIAHMRVKLAELEEVAHESIAMRDSMQQDKKLAHDLQNELEAKSSLIASLENKLSQMETEKSDIQQLQLKLDEESKLVASLRMELVKARDNEEQRAKLEEQSKHSQLELQRLRSKVSNLEMMLANAQSEDQDEEEFERMKVELMQADAARQEFEKKLYEERSEMQNLQTDLLSVQARLEESESEVHKLNEELDRFQTSTTKLEKVKQEDEALIERLQTELGAARMGLEQSLDELEFLKQQPSMHASQSEPSQSNAQDKAELERLRSQLAVAKDALDINIQEMEKLQKCVKESDASRMIAVRQSMNSQNEGQQNLEMLEAELAEAKETSRSKTEEVDRLRDQVAALQEELQEAMNNVDELQMVISNIQSAHDSELQDAKNIKVRSSKNVGKEINTLKVELTKNQISRADMQMEYLGKIHNLESKLDAMQTEAEEDLQHKIQEMNRLQMTVTSKEEEIRQLKKEREQICSSMNNLSSSRKDEMDELQEELLNLTAKTASQTREIQSLKMSLEEHDFRQSEFEKLKERIQELEDEVETTPIERSQISRTDVEILKAENKMLRESIRDLGVERRSLQEKLEAILATKSDSKSAQVLRERNSALKKEVEKLTKRLKKMEHSMTRFTI